VSVLIDGKQSSLTGFGNQKGLDNIPAGNIESIEIINNPQQSTTHQEWLASSTSFIKGRVIRNPW